MRRNKTGRKPRGNRLDGVTIIEGQRAVAGAKIAIVASRYNDDIVERLVQGCVATLTADGVAAENITLTRVPGAFELPVAAARLARRGRYAAIIALGAVIRGETPHFEYICRECAAGLSRVATETGIPVSFGVLTVDNLKQAEARCRGKGNKGGEAAHAALEMISLLRKIG
jgi:6,7-dimethyl-8-ribityllumazine synthase